MNVLSSPAQETQLLTQAPDEGWAEAPDADTVASLIPATPNSALRRIDFMRNASRKIVLGRAPPKGVAFPLCPTMSATHCIVEWNTGEPGTRFCNLITFTLHDRSSNGTYINNVRSNKGDIKVLNNRDMIHLGHQDLAFHFYQYRGLPPSCAIHDDYDIDMDKPLGRGTYASVYQALNRVTNEVFAVKIIDCVQGNMRSAQHRDMQYREIDIMRKVRHPHIMKMEADYFDEDGTSLYLVLEMMRGGNLLQVMLNQPTGRLHELTARSYTSQLVDALHYLHQRHIVHRDLKPENILLSEDLSIVKLADFGVSKIDNPVSGVHTMRGTVAYMAPEILDGRYTPLVDSYSLGIVIYNMVTGLAAFHESDDSADMRVIYSRVRKRKMDWHYLEEDEDLSDDVKNFVKQLVVHKPEDRMDMAQAKEHPWILLQNWSQGSYDDTQGDMSLDGPNFTQPEPSATSFMSDASGPAPTPPEATPHRPEPRKASTSPGTRMVRGRKSNADLSMASAQSAPPVRKGKRRARSVEREDEPDVLPVGSQKKRKVGGRGGQEDSMESIADGRRSRGATGERPLQRRRSARLNKDA